jgi:transcriptional regulator with XRE-family HTH domain
VGDRIATSLAFNIKRLREQRGMSQQQMADLSGVPRPTWANLESGEANPTIAVLTKVADALGTGVEDLLSSQHLAQFYPAHSLPNKNVGKVQVRRLSPESQTGLKVERWELPPTAELSAKPHAAGTQEVLTCESGELELTTMAQTWKLRAGDVIAFRSEQSHTYRNTGRARTVAYSIVTFAPISG